MNVEESSSLRRRRRRHVKDTLEKLVRNFLTHCRKRFPLSLVYLAHRGDKKYLNFFMPYKSHSAGI